MEMLVLKQEDRALITFELLRKLQEEVAEVKKATCEESIERVTEEVFDVVQVCIGILDQLQKIGLDVPGILEKHNKKLLTGDPLKPERPWEYEAVLHITKEGGSNGNT